VSRKLCTAIRQTRFLLKQEHAYLRALPRVIHSALLDDILNDLTFLNQAIMESRVSTWQYEDLCT
jgi:hypothetical protein